MHLNGLWPAESWLPPSVCDHEAHGLINYNSVADSFVQIVFGQEVIARTDVKSKK